MASGIFGPGGNISFDFEFPQSVNFSKSSNWKSLSAATGLPHPIHLYSLSDSATVSLTIRLSHANGGGIMGKLKQLRGLLYPSFNRSNPRVTVQIESYLNMKGFVSSYSESVPDDGGWIGPEPSVVDVSITITEDTGPKPKIEIP
jgi:hypothetical protein